MTVNDVIQKEGFLVFQEPTPIGSLNCDFHENRKDAERAAQGKLSNIPVYVVRAVRFTTPQIEAAQPRLN